MLLKRQVTIYGVKFVTLLHIKFRKKELLKTLPLFAKHTK